MTIQFDNRKVPHTVTLTEGQISTILFHLEGAVSKNAKNLDEVHGIFEVLEGAIDRWYDDHHGIQGKKLQSTQIASPVSPVTVMKEPQLPNLKTPPVRRIP